VRYLPGFLLLFLSDDDGMGLEERIISGHSASKKKEMNNNNNITQVVAVAAFSTKEA
jgi:hypothetical protein